MRRPTIDEIVAIWPRTLEQAKMLPPAPPEFRFVIPATPPALILPERALTSFRTEDGALNTVILIDGKLYRQVRKA
jgi:hypothetical protein